MWVQRQRMRRNEVLSMSRTTTSVHDARFRASELPFYPEGPKKPDDARWPSSPPPTPGRSYDGGLYVNNM